MFSHTLKKNCFYLLLLAALMLLAHSAIAQDKIPPVGGANVSVTATAASDHIRIAAPSAVVQLRLEVYDGTGQKLIDTEQRGGNVLDWHLKNGSGERVADGTYVCVVTIKSLSGRLSQKLGSITVTAESTALHAAGVTDLNAQQAQAVGPIEGEEGLTVMPAGQSQPVTVLANNGGEAQLTRTRGALTFRVGDFFSGNDKEQMRLTEEGNLGIGTSGPKAKLDVAGTIRAERVLIARPKTLGSNMVQANDLPANGTDDAQPLAAGSGTQNRIAKWLDNAGTLGDSVVIETSGNIGIGTTGPIGKLDVVQSASVFSINQTGAGLNVENSNSNGDAMISLTGGSSGGSGLITAMTTAQAPLPLRLYTGASERLRINTNGNVGIGTIGPIARLDVVQSAPVSTINQTNAGINVVNSNSNGDAMISLTGGAVAGSGIITAMNTAQAPLPLRFYTGTSERLRIDTIGNVGIGTSTPSQMLQLFKPGNTTNLISFGTDEWHIGNTNTSDFKIFRGAAAQLYLTSSGFVGIGTPTPSVKLDVSGDIRVSGNAVVAGNIAAKYQDIAEWVQARKPIAANTVVILDSTLANAVVPSARAYDGRVAGVVSAQPGIILGQNGAGKVLVATTGRVTVRVDATRRPIKIGDLLVTSDLPGVAMKSQPIRVRGALIHRPGTIIGKALEPLAHGEGKILVLLSLQ